MDDPAARAVRARKGGPFLSTAEAAHYLGLAPRTLQAYRTARTGPPFRRHGRHVVYHIDELDAWSKAVEGKGNGHA